MPKTSKVKQSVTPDMYLAKSEGCIWLHITTQKGNKAAVCLGQYAGKSIVGKALVESCVPMPRKVPFLSPKQLYRLEGVNATLAELREVLKIKRDQARKLKMPAEVREAALAIIGVFSQWADTMSKATRDYDTGKKKV